MVGQEAVANSRAGRPVAQVLAMLVLSILVPAVMLTGVLIWRAGRQEREQVNEQAIQLARSVATNLDREIDGSLETLVALSTSLSLQRGDFEGFYRQASETMAFRRVHVFLKALDGRQLVNTRVPWGTPLPALPPSAQDLDIIRTGGSVVSDLVVGAVAQQWVVGLGVPVKQGDNIRYVLAMSFDAEHFRRIVAETPRSPGWIIALSDKHGRLIARSEEHTRYFGQILQPDVQGWSKGTEGVHRTSTVTGESILRAYKWSSQSGWLTAASTPSEFLDGPLRLQWQLLAAFALVLAGVALPLAYNLAKQITGPIVAAAASAQNLVDARAINLNMQSRLLEANILSTALASAADTLKARTRALVENEARFRGVFEQSAVGFKQVASDGHLLGINDRLCKMLGYTREECMTASFRIQTHPDDRAVDAEQIAKLVAGGLPSYELEKRLITKSGEPIWVRVTATMVRLEDGSQPYRLSVVEDVSERRKAREAAARLASIVQASPDAMVSTNLAGVIETWNPAAEKLFGYLLDEAQGKSLSILAPPDMTGEFKSMLATAVRGDSVQVETVRRCKDGTLIDVAFSVMPIKTKNVVTSISVTMDDIRDRKRREKHIMLLNRELAHRVKNTLAVIQSIANQTMRSSPAPEQFRVAFQGRLQALAAANDLLMQTSWDGADAKEFIDKQLAALMPRNSVQLKMDGPRVVIPAEFSIPLGLALHELGTNAIKYGAWSVSGGQVRLDWLIKTPSPAEGRRLVITWTEENGPPVSTHDRRGFGTTLIERGIPGAIVERRFRPDGLVCTIEFDLNSDRSDDVF